MEEQTFKSGFVALVGRPNSGKSTLMNTLLGEHLALVTALPQTTRNVLRGIYTDKQMQIVFIDTPGIHQGKYIFNESMIRETKSILKKREVDLICYMVDLVRDFGNEESIVADIVKTSSIPVLLVFNKIDVCEKCEEQITKFFELFPHFSSTPSIRIAAIDPDAKDVFVNAIGPLLPPGPMYYDEDSLTDANMRFFAAEYIRKHIILNTRDEVPHAAFVEIESYKEEKTRHRIEATIHVETNGQRGIIVGKGGALITHIRKSAENDLSELVHFSVSIGCHIKVSPHWRDNERFLRFSGMPVK
jgi:GTPase